ncbi:MAG: cell division protein ZapA [Acidobacteria bacterium]|nr:cell division protein ZapA [Acidobacteriota bacterium]MBI3421448.1 cell division protein ZapA [Acidobacteriota bacterium]
MASNELNPRHPVKVEIFGQSYLIRPEDGEVHRTQALAAKVDQHMRDIARSAATADSLKIAILAALHIADELDKANERYEALNRRIAERSAECADVLDQALKNQR